jgi:aspartyl-tRNA(Asn)/glutamyl-tRNA(Gln) amidotransferase subunit C
VAVSEKDVLHVASLARVAIDQARLPSLVAELNGILEHMEVLERVETGSGMWDVGETGSATPMRSDEGNSPIPLAVPRDTFAPLMLDGFFLVPRLATHENQGEQSS